MIFLRVLPKIFMWPHYSGAPGARGPGSLNRLNPRFSCRLFQIPAPATEKARWPLVDSCVRRTIRDDNEAERVVEH